MSKGGYSAIAVPVAAAEMVEVVAPATLQEGYTFQAVYDGVTFPVTVPPGGVKEGQTLSVPFIPEASVSETTPIRDPEAPHGAWKDGLFDCCRFGPCHPSLWNACCCPQILMAQVLTRLKRNWLGDAAPDTEWRKTFRKILTIVICYWILNMFLSPPGPDYVMDEDNDKITAIPVDTPLWQRILYNLLVFCFGLYTLLVLMKTRRAVRERYEIPQTKCCGFEDICCSFWCGCCTVAQIARQTANYQDRRAVCCSDTGLPATSPVFVV